MSEKITLRNLGLINKEFKPNETPEKERLMAIDRLIDIKKKVDNNERLTREELDEVIIYLIKYKL